MIGEALRPRVMVLAVLTGLAAGIGGVALTLLLHLVQHLAFGYTEATFLTGVERASPARRVLALALGGAIVGTGWWALRRSRPASCTVEEALASPGLRLPVPATTAEASLQVIAVGFGASLGREGAPRQLGAALAAWLADRAGVSVGQRRTIVACGAGAGLASVYNVPLGGALFTLEILLVSAQLADVVPALLSAAVATATAWPVLSDRPTYLLAHVTFRSNELVFALLLGPVAGLIGWTFNRLATLGRSAAPHGWQLPLVITAAFTGLGALSIAFPQLLGNGKGVAQLAFDGTLALGTVGVLLVLKPLVTTGMLAAGANGGLLTPALATGALLGTLTGTAYSILWPGTPVAGFAMIGAAAVLATTLRAPLCAVVLLLEFTGTGLDLVVPMALAVAGAMYTSELLLRRCPAPADQ
ncbi:chloride channel protein [Nakamurella sp. PAMC28650]|uniref:chloride channel protein n=1 Tax=Nakamurella sp. PAMC28650 TaxID=2762325 RepID=UPI00164D2B44|nr:chloride channel protein [Nakamurella sp. PAMC28650]QNK79735.1 chloride channel protein [Nakamurella sp. PAMC28650]